VINWGCGLRMGGRCLLQSNRIPRDAKARRAMGWPVEKNPRRPIASHERYVRTRDRADEVDPGGRLRCILALARYTARREAAICALHVSDVLLPPLRVRTALASAGLNEADADHMPHGAICWRAEADKVGYLFVTPISADARAEIELYLRRNGRVGDVPLFPAPGQPARSRGTPELPIPTPVGDRTPPPSCH
jgi:integrase